MEERKHWLLSRKWWTALLVVIGVPLNQVYGIELPTEAIITVAIVAVGYIIGEGKVDVESLRSKTKEEEG